MKLNLMNLWTGGSVIVLVGSEILVCLYSGAWAVSGLLEFGPVVDVGLTVIATAISVVLTVVFARLVFKAEPLFGEARQDAEDRSDQDRRSGAVATAEVFE